MPSQDNSAVAGIRTTGGWVLRSITQPTRQQAQASASQSQGIGSRGMEEAPPSKMAALDHFQSATRPTRPHRIVV
jgi:hypothetical protein